MKILLVEDNRADAVLLREMLLSADPGAFDISCDDHLEKAVDRLKRDSFDAILLDLSLPDSQGLATLEHVQSVAKSVPMIVVTGLSDEKVAISAIRHGAQDYLVKGSLDGRGVAKAIRYAVDRKKAEEALRQSEAAYTAAKASVDTVNAMTAGVALVYMNGQVISVNPAFEKVTGYRNNELAGRDAGAVLRAMVSPGDLRRALDILSGAQEGKPVDSFPVTIIAKNGGPIPLIASISHIREAAGTPTAMVLTVSDISELKHAEDRLRRSEATLAEAQRIAHIGNWDWNIVTNKLECSDEIYRIFGLTPRAFGDTFDALLKRVHPDDRELVNNAVKKAIEEEQRYGLDHRIILPDRSERLVHQQAEVFCDETGRPIRMLGIMQDVTEEREAEKRDRIIRSLLTLFATQSSRKEYLDAVVKLLRHASKCRCVGIRIMSLDGFIPYEAFVGFGEEFLNKESMLCISQDLCACARVITGITEPCDLQLMTATGSFVCNDTAAFVRSLAEEERPRYRGNCAKHGYLSMAVIPIRHLDKNVGAIHLADQRQGVIFPNSLAFMETIAPLIGEAVFRFQMEDAVRESEAKYRTLVEHLPAITYTTETNNAEAILYVSPQVETILGFSPKEFLEDTELRIRQLHPDDRARAVAELRSAHARKAPFTLEYRILARDGREVWIRDQAALIANEQGKPPLYQGVMYDVTEHKKAEEALEVYQNELRSLSFRLSLAEERARRELAVALHDSVGQSLALSKLKLGELGQLLTTKKAKKELEEIREMFEQAVKQTRTLSFELSPPILYELGLDAAIEWLGEEFQRRHGFKFHFKSDGDKSELDESVSVLIFQSVRELLVNAGKHAAAANVRVSSRSAGGHIAVTVKDDGKGFDCNAAILPDGDKNSLGLFSVRERMRHIGGVFQIDSKPGKGTSVTLRCPMGHDGNGARLRSF